MNAKAKRICSRGYRRRDLWNEPLVRPTLYKAGMNPDSVLFFQIFIRDPGIRYHDQSERAEL